MSADNRRVKVSSSRIIDYRSLNEQQVEDITLDFFYKPHTLTLLSGLLLALLYTACTRDNSDETLNVYHGVLTIRLASLAQISLETIITRGIFQWDLGSSTFIIIISKWTIHETSSSVLENNLWCRIMVFSDVGVHFISKYETDSIDYDLCQSRIGTCEARSGCYRKLRPEL